MCLGCDEEPGNLPWTTSSLRGWVCDGVAVDREWNGPRFGPGFADIRTTAVAAFDGAYPVTDLGVLRRSLCISLPHDILYRLGFEHQHFATQASWSSTHRVACLVGI